MPKFRKKSVAIEAIQYTGNNGFECVKFGEFYPCKPDIFNQTYKEEKIK